MQQNQKPSVPCQGWIQDIGQPIGVLKPCHKVVCENNEKLPLCRRCLKSFWSQLSRHQRKRINAIKRDDYSKECSLKNEEAKLKLAGQKATAQYQKTQTAETSAHNTNLSAEAFINSRTTNQPKPPVIPVPSWAQNFRMPAQQQSAPVPPQSSAPDQAVVGSTTTNVPENEHRMEVDAQKSPATSTTTTSSYDRPRMINLDPNRKSSHMRQGSKDQQDGMLSPNTIDRIVKQFRR